MTTQLSIANKLDNSIALGKEANVLTGFEKAFKLAEAVKDLSGNLTKEYMTPIMQLQNNRLGFKTDKDNGYPIEVVKNCLIEAVLTGVQPVNNHFNIIAGNCYITKEGFGYMLSNIPNLKWEIIPNLPRISPNNPSAAIVMKIRWAQNSQEWEEREIDFAIKVNKFMGADAVIGKATRKARAWLFGKVTNCEVADGDADTLDISHEEVSQTVQKEIKEESNKEELSLDTNENKEKPQVNKENPNAGLTTGPGF